MCIPFHLGAGASDRGPRLGGNAPAGVYPTRHFSETRYFATIPLSSHPTLELSIFLSFDFDAMASLSGSLHSSDLVEAVVHPPAARGEADLLVSELTPHPIVLEALQDDVTREEGADETPLSGHKIGGSPYTIDDPLEFVVSAGALRGAQGFVHLVQFDFPGGGGDALVGGSWPFGGGMCHLFVRDPMGTPEWKWFWEL